MSDQRSSTGLPLYRTPAAVRSIPTVTLEGWVRAGAVPLHLFADLADVRLTLDTLVSATRRRLDAMELPPGARRLDVRATRAAFAAGTLGTVGDDPSGEDGEGNVVAGDADRDYPHDVQHGSESRWTEAERQAFLRRVQRVDPRERRA